MGRPRERTTQSAKPPTSLGEHLKYVPVCPHHRIEDLADEISRNIVVEQIGHGVHKDTSGALPLEGELESFRPETEIESLLKVMPGYVSESLGKCQSIAMITPGRDLGASRYRIPRCICPFDCGLVGHGVMVERLFGIVKGIARFS